MLYHPLKKCLLIVIVAALAFGRLNAAKANFKDFWVQNSVDKAIIDNNKEYKKLRRSEYQSRQMQHGYLGLLLLAGCMILELAIRWYGGLSMPTRYAIASYVLIAVGILVWVVTDRCSHPWYIDIVLGVAIYYAGKQLCTTAKNAGCSKRNFFKRVQQGLKHIRWKAIY